MASIARWMSKFCRELFCNLPTTETIERVECFDSEKNLSSGVEMKKAACAGPQEEDVA